MTQIALIHIQMVSAAAMQAAFREQWPETSVINILDEELFHSPAKGQDYVARQFTAIAAYAADGGADAILFTCSAFTAAIGRVKAVLAPLPVLAPNEALIEEAVASGGSVGLLATFGPTLDAMPSEFPAGVLVGTALADGAYAALNAGEMERHNRLIAEAAASKLAHCDVIALAQASMASAARAVAASTGKLVLSSPVASVRKLRCFFAEQV